MLTIEAKPGSGTTSSGWDKSMTSLRVPVGLFSIVVLYWFGPNTYGQSSGRLNPEQDQTSSPTPATSKDLATARLPRGKKLVLKDGNFQLVRSYERVGARVRYFSVERGDWEEIPAAMVDWAATAKAEAEEEKTSEALLKKVHTQEQAQNIVAVVDVDASLQVASGIFLPPGEGMFVVEGRAITLLEQVGSQIKVDKKRVLEQVLSPVPLVPSKHHIEIPGAKAKVRITTETGSPEFYLREAPPDPDRTTPIHRSSRPGESGPEVELVRASVKGNKRQLEAITSMFGQEVSRKSTTISIQRWEIAPGVYRFTLSEPLAPGEYALAEVLPDGMNLYVWDFGVDGGRRSP